MYKTCMYYAIVHTRLIHGSDMYMHLWKCIDIYIYFCKFINMYVHGIDMHIHNTVSTCMYIVQTCMSTFIQVYTRFDLYKHVHIMYKLVRTCLFHISYLHACMSRYVLLMFRVQMATYISRNLQSPLNCVHTLMYPFDFRFLFCPAGWPVGRD